MAIHGAPGLRAMIDDGRLMPDELIYVGRRGRDPIEATIKADGRIDVGGALFDTPTAAAKHALGVPSVDGWLRWRVPRLVAVTLAEVRDGPQAT